MRKTVYRKLFSVLVAYLMIFSLTSPTYAATIESKDSNDFDEESLQIQNNAELSDSAKLEGLAKVFFSAKEANYKSDTDIDLSFLYDSVKNANFAKMKKMFDYEKGIRTGIKAKIAEDNLAISVNDIDIGDDFAKLIIYENYVYTLQDSENGASSRGIIYYLDFAKVNDQWKISNITSNSEIEQYVASDNINNILSKNLSGEKETEVEQSKTEVGVSATSAYTYHSYSGSAAGNYALTYSNSSHSTSDSSPYNPLFKQYNPNDCQNFASQCVWAGLGGVNNSSSINNKNTPMIASGTRAWYNTSSGGVSTWTSISYFTNYVNAGTNSIQGIVGMSSTGNLSDIGVGDLIQIQDSDGVYYHTYIVSAVTGAAGYRTNADIWVCAHSSNRSNERLDTIIGTSQSGLRMVKISGTYY